MYFKIAAKTISIRGPAHLLLSVFFSSFQTVWITGVALKTPRSKKLAEKFIDKLNE